MLQEGDPEGWWEESFKTHKDTKPYGPQAISLDLDLPAYRHVYGIPEHATSFALGLTVGACCANHSNQQQQLVTHPLPVCPVCKGRLHTSVSKYPGCKLHRCVARLLLVQWSARSDLCSLIMPASWFLYVQMRT